jgi:hypothetical protein
LTLPNSIISFIISHEMQDKKYYSFSETSSSFTTPIQI